MGKHSKPTETIEDLDAEQLFQLFWNDYSDDGEIDQVTMTKAMHWAISVAHGVVVAVLLVVLPEIWGFLKTGQMDWPGFLETVKVTAIAAVTSHFRPRR